MKFGEFDGKLLKKEDGGSGERKEEEREKGEKEKAEEEGSRFGERGGGERERGEWGRRAEFCGLIEKIIIND